MCFLQKSFKKFPFDVQYCQVEIESFFPSYIVNVSQINVFLDSVHHFVYPEEVWTFEGVTSHLSVHRYPNWDGEFQRAKFTFQVRRKPALFIITIFVPGFCLMILQLSSVIMPAKYPDRPVYNVTGWLFS